MALMEDFNGTDNVIFMDLLAGFRQRRVSGLEAAEE
jgi:hypothetical protein